MKRRSILRGIIAALTAPRELLAVAMKPKPEEGYWEYTFGGSAEPVWRTFTANPPSAIKMRREVTIELPAGAKMYQGDYARE